jgi:hypothetical protein
VWCADAIGEPRQLSAEHSSCHLAGDRPFNQLAGVDIVSIDDADGRAATVEVSARCGDRVLLADVVDPADRLDLLIRPAQHGLATLTAENGGESRERAVHAIDLRNRPCAPLQLCHARSGSRCGRAVHACGPHRVERVQPDTESGADRLDQTACRGEFIGVFVLDDFCTDPVPTARAASRAPTRQCLGTATSDVEGRSLTPRLSMDATV